MACRVRGTNQSSACAVGRPRAAGVFLLESEVRREKRGLVAQRKTRHIGARHNSLRSVHVPWLSAVMQIRTAVQRPGVRATGGREHLQRGPFAVSVTVPWLLQPFFPLRHGPRGLERKLPDPSRHELLPLCQWLQHAGSESRRRAGVSGARQPLHTSIGASSLHCCWNRTHTFRQTNNRQEVLLE